MNIPWTEGLRPHLVAGGRNDGLIVSYYGNPPDPIRGYNYSIPGILTFLPLYVEAGAMVPLLAEQANLIMAGRRLHPKENV